MRVAGFQARAEHEDLWFDDAPPFKAFQSGAISESEYLVGLAEFLGLTREQGGGRFASSPCLQGEVSAEAKRRLTEGVTRWGLSSLAPAGGANRVSG